MRRLFFVLAAMMILGTMAEAQALPPDFSLTLTITEIKTFPNRTIGLVAIVTSVNSSWADITITLSGLPAGWTVISHNSTGRLYLSFDQPKAIAFIIVIPAGQSPGQFTGTITAMATGLGN